MTEWNEGEIFSTCRLLPNSDFKWRNPKTNSFFTGSIKSTLWRPKEMLDRNSTNLPYFPCNFMPHQSWFPFDIVLTWAVSTMRADYLSLALCNASSKAKQTHSRSTRKQWVGDPSLDFFHLSLFAIKTWYALEGHQVCSHPPWCSSCPPLGCTPLEFRSTDEIAAPEEHRVKPLWSFRILPHTIWPTAVQIAVNTGLVQWHTGNFFSLKPFFWHGIKTLQAAWPLTWLSKAVYGKSKFNFACSFHLLNLWVFFFIFPIALRKTLRNLSRGVCWELGRFIR